VKAQHNLKEAELDAKGQIELAERMKKWRPGQHMEKWKKQKEWTGEESYEANYGYGHQGLDNPQQPQLGYEQQQMPGPGCGQQSGQYSQQQTPPGWGCGPMPQMQATQLWSASADMNPYAAQGGPYGQYR